MNTLHVRNRREWREWLSANFESEKEIWLVFPTRESQEPGISYNDAVEEALCFGWIDGQAGKLDALHSVRRFTPRRSKSGYSRLNIERLIWLEQQGMIHPKIRQEVLPVLEEPYSFPQDIMEAIEKDPEAAANYHRCSPSYQRIRIAHIDDARNDSEEFSRRLRGFIEKTRQNKPISPGGDTEKYYRMEKQEGDTPEDRETMKPPKNAGGRKRCFWCNLKNPIYIAYHDTEWGVFPTDERKLYELFILETFQAGLSWECVLNKRENFRKAFDGFDLEKVCAYDEDRIEELMGNAGIIRNRAKLTASVRNSRVYKSIIEEFGSFASYLRKFTGGTVIREANVHVTKSPLSDAISADLKKRGMSFVGSTTIYAFLQAVGIINAHQEDCFRSREMQEQEHP